MRPIDYQCKISLVLCLHQSCNPIVGLHNAEVELSCDKQTRACSHQWLCHQLKFLIQFLTHNVDTPPPPHPAKWVSVQGAARKRLAHEDRPHRLCEHVSSSRDLQSDQRHIPCKSVWTCKQTMKAEERACAERRL